MLGQRRNVPSLERPVAIYKLKLGNLGNFFQSPRSLPMVREVHLRAIGPSVGSREQL